VGVSQNVACRGSSTRRDISQNEGLDFWYIRLIKGSKEEKMSVIIKI